MPWNTPTAVSGAVSPAPPAAGVLPNTYGVISAITSISADDVLMSGAQLYRPPSELTNAPYSRINRFLAAPCGSSGVGSAITALPPPWGNPTQANFKVIASARRMPSASASLGPG